MKMKQARTGKNRVDIFGERLRSREKQLSPRLLAVARYIDQQRGNGAGKHRDGDSTG
jgi:hypothetical protein